MPRPDARTRDLFIDDAYYAVCHVLQSATLPFEGTVLERTRTLGSRPCVGNAASRTS
jgi:hypothetical protein